jgi:hypothetical protein
MAPKKATPVPDAIRWIAEYASVHGFVSIVEALYSEDFLHKYDVSALWDSSVPKSFVLLQVVRANIQCPPPSPSLYPHNEGKRTPKLPSNS